MSNETFNLLVICGPTASGKTRLAVACALALNGEILSADSRQVYRGMDIGTGKDRQEYTTPHGTVACHLIDIADPAEIYTLHQYQKDCYRTIREVLKRGRLPVLTGGTGLYIESVLKKYAIPGVPEDPSLRAALMDLTKEELMEKLRCRAPDLHATADLTSKKRIVRALEIAVHRQGSAFPESVEPPPEMRPVILCVRWPRQVLLERITARLKQRLEQGLIDEVRDILRAGIPAKRFGYFGMEYRHIPRYLCGEIDYQEMVGALTHDIGQFAKRQMTWFRGMERRGARIHWIDGTDPDCARTILDRFRFDPGDAFEARRGLHVSRCSTDRVVNSGD
jgi:tRNA dimethylallyltransferase